MSFQAIAVVFGFLVTIALIIMLVFALKTRQKIGNYGKSNILWKKVKVIDEMEPPRDVEAWVSGGVLAVASGGSGHDFNTLAWISKTLLIRKSDLPGREHGVPTSTFHSCIVNITETSIFRRFLM